MAQNGEDTQTCSSSDVVLSTSSCAASDAASSSAAPAGTIATAVDGWTDAPSDGENVAEQTVTGMRRIPIDGLTSVNQNPASDPHAIESAAGRAIASFSTALDIAQAIEILLHLHGFNIGYRQRAATPSNTDPGTVRDKLQDQIEMQVAASGRSMIALLPQGTLHSGFGPGNERFDCSTFITEVLSKLVSLGVLQSVPSISRVVLSAHSGGGGAVATMLLEADQPRLPSSLGALFYFEAINGTGELSAARAWITGQLTADLTALQALGSDDEQAAYVATSFRFRGFYFTQDDFYVANYTGLNTSIDAWFKMNAQALGGTSSPNSVALRANYQVIAASPYVGHDKIVGATLQTALAALP